MPKPNEAPPRRGVWRCDCGKRDYTKPCECTLQGDGPHEQSKHFKEAYMRAMILDCACMKARGDGASE